MNSEGRANTGPVDFFYLLKRRKVSFHQWCQSLGIQTKEDFFQARSQVVKQGEFYFPQEMIDLDNSLPEALEVAVQPEFTRTPTLPPPSLLEPSVGEETPVPPRKNKKQVSS